MRTYLLCLLMIGAAANTACTMEHPSIAIGKRVAVEKLDAGEYAGRFKAIVVSDGKANGLDHAVALMHASSEGCRGHSFLTEDQSPALRQLQAVPSAGQTLSMTVACGHDRMPGYRTVTQAEARNLGGMPEEGVSDKIAYSHVRNDEKPQLVGERLIGGFLREVYTEECAGKAVLVEKIVMASEPREPTPELSGRENMHAVMHYRCVSAAPGGASVATTTE